MKPWYLDMTYWLKTTGGCCSNDMLMGKQEEDGSWTYAIVQLHDGQKTLKAQFNSGVLSV